MLLPNFLIIGAQKAGTTSLYHYCRQHPDIFMSRVKEPMFFNSMTPPKTTPEQSQLSEPYYFFDLSGYGGLFAGAKTDQPRGEASTAYLANPSCAVWIRKIIPEAKIIAILRNPLERAYSAHRMYFQKGVEKRPFEEAISFELVNGSENVRQGRQYLKLGLYASQLQSYFKHFPREQLLISDYDEYNRDNVAYLGKIFRFLGVKEFVPKDLRRLLVSDAGKERRKVDGALGESMRKYFEKDICQLETMVDFEARKWLA